MMLYAEYYYAVIHTEEQNVGRLVAPLNEQAPHLVHGVNQLITAGHQHNRRCVLCKAHIVEGWYLVSVCSRLGARRYGCYPVHLHHVRSGTIGHLQAFFAEAAHIPGAAEIPIQDRPDWWWPL